jgi:hypothetical protein
MKNNVKKKAVRGRLVAGYVMIAILLLTFTFVNTRAMAATVQNSIVSPEF